MLEMLFVLAMILGYGDCQYIIQDVWGEPPNSVAGWTYTLCTGSTYTSTCGGQTIIGGYGVLGVNTFAYKTYSGLPSHNTVTVQWDAYYVDAWDGTYGGGSSSPPWYDSYLLYVDGFLPYWDVYVYGTNSNVSICGNPAYSDWIRTVALTLPHNSSTIQLNFTTGLNQGCTDESFGFKNIQITIDAVCMLGCTTCYGNTNTQCYSCSNGWYLSGNTCVTTCPTGQWGNPSGNVCQNCYSRCYNCNGGSSSNCVQCSGAYLNLPPTGSCSSSCPGGYYPYNGSWECLQCYQGSGPNYTCATCWAGASNNCYSCNSGSFLYNHQCLNQCPNGYWEDSSTHICQPCYSSSSSPYSCTTCSAAGSTNCTSCSSPYFLYPSTGGQCLNPCPNFYWGDSSTNSCQPCYSSGSGPYYTCATCSAGGSSNCDSCNPGTFLYNSQCTNHCPVCYWGNTATNTCQPCYSSSIGPYYSCATCSSGGANNNCDSCNSGSFLYSSQCLSACPDGYWPDNTTNTCELCSSDTVNISSCPTNVESKIIPALQISAKSTLTALVATSAALQNSNSASSLFSVTLLLYLSAIEAIANMQYLNLNHSQIALDAYSGLSSCIIPNWISNYNTINSRLLVFNYGIFEKDQTSPLYLDNYGDSLTETLIYAGVYLILVPITFIKTPEKLLSSRLGKALTIALGLFFSNIFGEIQSQILFSVLQILKTDLLVDAYSRWSYSIAWLTMFGLIWLQLFCFRKLNAIFSLKQRYKKMINVNSDDTNNENELTAGTIISKWTEKQYKMMFSSFKDDKKLRFFFTYWVILFDTIYITLILCLQYMPGLQCISIVLLTIYFIVFSATLRPMKEKSEAFLFFFNYNSVLLVAILNLALAAREASESQPTNNDDIGWAIFIIIAVNSCVNTLFAIWEILSRIYSLYRKWKGRRQKANEETKTDQTIGKSRSSQIASRSIDSSNSASNFSVEEEQKKEETPEPQSKLHIKERKVINKKHEHSLRRKEKKINIPGLE